MINKTKTHSDYTLKIDNFEGPLALLYHLIEKNKMNIYEVKINEITDQYLEYIKQMERMDLEVTSEFILMASTLLHIKSRSLLPRKKIEEELDGVDPEEEIVLKLIEYKKYKEMSDILKIREEKWEKVFYNIGEKIKFKTELSLEEISVDNLLNAYKKIIVKNEKKVNRDVDNMDTILQYEKVSIKSKIRDVLKALMKNTMISFNKMFSLNTKSKTEVVTAFMAILELARNSKVELLQKSLFSEILVKRKYFINQTKEENEI